MVEDMLSAYGSRLVIAVVGVGIGFIVLIVALWLIRGRRGPSPFVRGGKNRQPRLQVLDAAAVDARRRLVLVRRDNVEHLIMIGGPTDIVIESGIGTPGAGMVLTAAPATGQIAAPEKFTAAIAAPSDSRMAPTIAPTAEPRPLPVQRPVPPEARAESVREIVTPLREETQRPAPAPMQAAMPVQSAAQAVVEPHARPVPEVKAESTRPIAALAATNAATVDNAVDLLDAARSRVFQEATEPRVVPLNPANIPPVFQPAAENPKQLGSDFERILEQEMANNLASREAAAPGAATRQIPTRDPANPRVTGATPEPSLQAEVARIFGEMSVGRDK